MYGYCSPSQDCRRPQRERRYLYKRAARNTGSQVGNTLYVTECVSIKLCNTLDNGRVEIIRVLRDGACYLHHALTLQWRSKRMLRYEQAGIQALALDDIVPALPEVEFYISRDWPFDQRMSIVPGVWAGAFFVAAQRRRERVRWHIPAVIVAV